MFLSIRHIILLFIVTPIQIQTQYLKRSSATYKLLRWECNTSNLMFINTKCRARSLSRSAQAVDFEFEAKKKLSEIKVRYVGMVKPINGQFWRQFLKFDNLDLCAIWTGGHEIGFIQSVQETYFRLFPKLPRKCPMEKGKYSAKNVTVFTAEEVAGTYDEPEGYISTRFPNGIYRHTMRFYSSYVQIYDSMGEDRL